jgi:hypothetical protein
MTQFANHRTQTSRTTGCVTMFTIAYGGAITDTRRIGFIKKMGDKKWEASDGSGWGRFDTKWQAEAFLVERALVSSAGAGGLLEPAG